MGETVRREESGFYARILHVRERHFSWSIRIMCTKPGMREKIVEMVLKLPEPFSGGTVYADNNFAYSNKIPDNH